jgi:hypothetical protein
MQFDRPPISPTELEQPGKAPTGKTPRQQFDVDAVADLDKRLSFSMFTGIRWR